MSSTDTSAGEDRKKNIMHSSTATSLLFGAALRFGVSAGGALRGLVCLLVLTGMAVIPARPAAAQSALPTMGASAGAPVTAKFSALYGTYTWRVSGKAVTMSSEEPVYVYDNFEMVNFRLESDVYKDTSGLITKTVTLSP